MKLITLITLLALGTGMNTVERDTWAKAFLNADIENQVHFSEGGHRGFIYTRIGGTNGALTYRTNFALDVARGVGLIETENPWNLEGKDATLWNEIGEIIEANYPEYFSGRKEAVDAALSGKERAYFVENTSGMDLKFTGKLLGRHISLNYHQALYKTTGGYYVWVSAIDGGGNKANAYRTVADLQNAIGFSPEAKKLYKKLGLPTFVEVP